MNKKIWSKFLELADKGKAWALISTRILRICLMKINYDYYELIIARRI